MCSKSIELFLRQLCRHNMQKNCSFNVPSQISRLFMLNLPMAKWVLQLYQVYQPIESQVRDLDSDLFGQLIPTTMCESVQKIVFIFCFTYGQSKSNYESPWAATIKLTIRLFLISYQLFPYYTLINVSIIIPNQ